MRTHVDLSRWPRLWADRDIRNLILNFTFAMLVAVCIFVAGLWQFGRLVQAQRKAALAEKVSIVRHALRPTLEALRQGRLGREAALLQAQDVVRSLIYEDEFGANYFFMNGMDGRVLVRPYRREDEQKADPGFVDARGTAVFQEVIPRLLKRPDGVYFAYRFPKPGSGVIEEKLSYFVYVPELDVMLGTGSYLGSAQRAQGTLLRSSLVAMVVLLGIFALPVLVALRRLKQRNASLAMEMEARFQVETSLRESEERNRAILDAMPDLVIVVDEDGYIVDHNNPAGSALVVTPDVLGERSLAGLLPVELVALAMSRLRDTTAQQRANRFDYDLEVRGETRSFDARLVPCGRGKGLVVLRDMTEERRADLERERLQLRLSQAQKLEAIGRLAGGIAHDFNNMLCAVMGNVDLAIDGAQRDLPVEGYLEKVAHSVKRSASLTRQLLAFARLQPAEANRVDLNAVVEDVLKMLRCLLAENIELLWLPGQAVEAVRVDPGQIDQCLTNLCVNARDAIEGRGKIVVETTLVCLDEEDLVTHPEVLPGRYVRLSVSDTGCGMDRDTLARVFDPFFTTKDVGKGTGLGLSSVYGAVRQCGGFINAYSEPGFGTTFNLYFPSHGHEEPVPAPEVLDPEGWRGQGTLLVVEDEPAVLGVVSEFLDGLGYTVVAASSPQEALRLAAEGDALLDLMLTDVMMPHMNGVELAQAILATRPGMPVLFMSGHTFDVVDSLGCLSDADHFIRKPFTLKELAMKIRAVLDLHAKV